MPRQTRQVNILLETRNCKLGRLLDETSPNNSPQKNPFHGAHTDEGLIVVSGQTTGINK